MLFVFPAILWFIFGAVALLQGSVATISEAWRHFALPLAVIISAGHMAKGLAKFVSWAGFLPYALKEPAGVKTALGITSKTLPAPASLLSPSVVSAVGAMLVIAGLYFAMREFCLPHPKTYHRRLVPAFALAGFFVFIIAGWR